MPIVRIDPAEIVDWDSFHRVFARELGFPTFYGGNVDAMIDCLSYVDDPSAGMTNVHVRSGEMLAIHLGSIARFKRTCPDQFEALQDACAFVNLRRVDRGAGAILALCYNH